MTSIHMNTANNLRNNTEETQTIEDQQANSYFFSWNHQENASQSNQANNTSTNENSKSEDNKNEESSSICVNEEQINLSHSDASLDSGTISTKKKTPMCLVNELARHHKLQPQYRLIEESGKAHEKTFMVNLKLGEEEYSASGQSIKKAQHAAAQIALLNTTFQLPQPKEKVKNSCPQNKKPPTPTVELNALAMKLNLPSVYTNLTPLPICNEQSTENFSYSRNSYSALSSPVIRRGDFRLNQSTQGVCRFLNADFQAPYATPPRFPLCANQNYYRHNTSHRPVLHRVSLSVGRVFVEGEGGTPQAARHDAARKALEELRREIPNDEDKRQKTGLIADVEHDSELKSPISLLHELALKLNQTVDFSVLSETGPPHMRHFVVQCKLDFFVTQGEGNCKKLAKKKAAELMLETVKKVHASIFTTKAAESNTACIPLKSKPTVNRKKPKNLVKTTSSSSSIGAIGAKTQDPISQLVQLMQSRKEKEPVFVVISEKGIPRQPEFIVRCTVASIAVDGIGPKKRDAKRAAALKALQELEVLDFSDEQTDSTPLALNGNSTELQSTSKETDMEHVEQQPKQMEVIQNITEPVRLSVNNDLTAHLPKTSLGLRPEVRLRYLAKVLEYEVEFSDFPKGKKGEFVTLVSLNSVPPQVSHGLGNTIEEAHDAASSNMLQLLAEGGFDLPSSRNGN